MRTKFYTAWNDAGVYLYDTFLWGHENPYTYVAYLIGVSVVVLTLSSLCISCAV